MDQKFEEIRGKGPDAFTGIPENYFKEFPDRLLLSREKKIIKKSLLVRPAFRAVAAVMLILISIGVLLVFNIPEPDVQNVAQNYPAIEQSQEFTINYELPGSDTGIAEYDSSVILNDPTLSSDPANGFEDLFAELDEIPFDEILDYLAEADEFEF